MSCLVRMAILCCLSVFLFGCAASQRSVAPIQKIFDTPQLHIENTAELGDTIVAKGKIYTYDGIELLNQVQAGDGFIIIKFTVAPQKLLMKLEDDSWQYYYGDNVTAYDAIVGTKPVMGGLKLSRNEPGKIAIFANSPHVTLSPNPEPKIEKLKVSALDKPSFKQELIYNGRAGNYVKFLYRELSNDMMRAPFNQEVQYDLSESSIIGFKGVRIEILNASNTTLQYRVLSSFPDPAF